MISNWSFQPPWKTRARQAGSITTSKIDKIISQSCINSMVSPCFRPGSIPPYLWQGWQAQELVYFASAPSPNPWQFPSFPKSPFLSGAPEKRQTQMLNAGFLECRPCVKLKDFKESGPQKNSSIWKLALCKGHVVLGSLFHQQPFQSRTCSPCSLIHVFLWYVDSWHHPMIYWSTRLSGHPKAGPKPITWYQRPRSGQLLAAWVL